MLEELQAQLEEHGELCAAKRAEHDALRKQKLSFDHEKAAAAARCARS